MSSALPCPAPLSEGCAGKKGMLEVRTPGSAWARLRLSYCCSPTRRLHAARSASWLSLSPSSSCASSSQAQRKAGIPGRLRGRISGMQRSWLRHNSKPCGRQSPDCLRSNGQAPTVLRPVHRWSHRRHDAADASPYEGRHTLPRHEALHQRLLRGRPPWLLGRLWCTHSARFLSPAPHRPHPRDAGLTDRQLVGAA